MINPNNYYTVQGWMLSELGLKGNALAAYAIIYGFSQDGVSEYAGSSKYLCEWMNCSKKTVLTTLANLTEQGLLVKKTLNKNGVIFNNYVAVRRPQNHHPQGGEDFTPPGEILPQGGEDFTPGRSKIYTGGGEEITPHNILHNDIHTPSDKDGAAADAPPDPAPEEKPKTEKPTKHKHGQYGHVRLTQAEKATLEGEYGTDLTAKAITHLDEYIEEKGYKSKSHYLAIRRWVVAAVLEREKRPTRTQAGCWSPGPVGPNGIKIDQSKNDLDGLF